MDEEVARLVREERILAAAELASSRGDARAACALFERACEWSRAAREAIVGRDFARALPLAIEGHDVALAERALDEVAREPNVAERLAYQLERRGDALWAARLFELIGKPALAARAWEHAGDAVRSSVLLERANDVVGASRVLEAAIRKDPSLWALNVALGGLLTRYGKTEAAIRVLQKVPAGTAERREALSYLVKGLERLGLAQARAEAWHELSMLGGAVEAAQPEPAKEVKARIFGRYEVVREVASSPSARVVECVDGVRGEHVAVKIFAGYDARGGGRDALARFEREVKVLGAMDHPNVVPLRDYIPEGPALVLAWMGGGTLESMMKVGSLAPARAVEIASAVLSALGEAHRLGVLHRDVKPANVLFDDAGVARLGDFGVAHLGDLSATATAGVIGTLAYMSPEQREGRPATVQSDLYGVGAILWEMLTSERPSAVKADESGPSLEWVPRTRPSGVHRDLDARHDAVVLGMIANDAAARPVDAFAARRALTALAWATTIEPIAAVPRSERPRSLRGGALRVLAEPDGRLIDRWIGREIQKVKLTDQSLARASAFARAGHPALQTVLRVDRDDGSIWLAAPRGRLLAAALSDPQASSLESALDSLHRAGAIHGAIDSAHVRIDDHGAAVLAFEPELSPTATVDLDRLALARLANG